MNTIRQGIVLAIPNHQTPKITLLDCKRGVIQAFIQGGSRNRHSNLLPGMLIAYHIPSSPYTAIKITDISILKLPLAPLCSQLTYVHQVIALLLQFCQEDSSEPLLFDEISMLYDEQYQNLFQDSLFIKLCIGRFFYILGIYPQEDIYIKYYSMYTILALPAALLSIAPYQTISHETIDTWLLSCFSTNPHASILMPLGRSDGPDTI